MNKTTLTTKNTYRATAITHAGLFHADEVLATVILKQFFRDLKVARVFKVPSNTIAFIYDIGNGAYDHHQKGGNGCRENGVPYAASGLIWRDYGQTALKVLGIDENIRFSVWKEVDKNLIQSVDAIDNGIMSKAYLTINNSVVEYPVHVMTFSQIIFEFNPKIDDNIDSDEAFEKAVHFAEIVFNNSVKNAVETVKSTSIIEQTIRKVESKM